ncbi:MAG: prolyl oligopeptidase family serine peptidase, partial [Proteobacteria bacterium]|nr:prolyl oligopeptidase family serine peptidase [Pseudomonadota bacterium]
MNIAEVPTTIKRVLAAALVLITGLTGCSSAPPQADATQANDGFVRLGNLVVNGVPEISEEVRSLLLPYENVRSARFAGWIGDGLLISTRFAETSQVHYVATPGGNREQLTFFDEPVAAVYVPPGRSDEGFAYLRDVGGSEFYQLFWYDRRSATSTLLTDGKSRNSALRWSNRGDQFAYTTTRRNGTNSDIHVQNLNGEETVAVETQGGSWLALDWSPADDRLLVQHYVSINQSILYEVDLESGVLTPLFDETPNAAFGDALYDRSGGGIYLTSDMGAEFMRLHHLDLTTGELTVVTGDIPWNVEQFLISPDGSTLAFVVNEGGLSRAYAWRLPNRSLVALPAIPPGIIGEAAFSEDSGHLALSLNRASSPADVYSIDLKDRTLVRWTRSEVGGLDPDSFVEPELISYPTFDSDTDEPRQIPAFVYRPAGEGPHPVVISIHGGPEAQYRPYFSSVVQSYVTGLGAAVIAPNVRGSNGYGKSYLKLDNGFLREDSVKDIGALLDWIESDPGLDASRIVVMGGSYGGYMVLASMVHYSDRLLAGVERVGISNWVTFLENTQNYRRDLRRAEYGDERDPVMREYLERISPLNHVSRMTRPLYIAQGLNDPRVPAS